VGDIDGAGYTDEDDVEVSGCTAAPGSQTGYQFSVLCLGALELPLGLCVFAILDFHKVDVSVPCRNKGGARNVCGPAGGTGVDQNKVWARAGCLMMGVLQHVRKWRLPVTVERLRG